MRLDLIPYAGVERGGFAEVAHHFGAAQVVVRREDRGVVAILDSRIVTKRYGSVLLNSMPPLWRTSDKDVVRESLKRLNEGL